MGKAIKSVRRALLAGAIAFFPFLQETALADSALASQQALPEEYIFDLWKKYPKIIPAWKGVVPLQFARDKWIKSLDGTTFPIERVVIGGRHFIAGAVCKPHDCGGNTVAFLIALDGSRAYGLLRSDTPKANNRAFGAPGDDALKILSRALAKEAAGGY